MIKFDKKNGIGLSEIVSVISPKSGRIPTAVQVKNN